MLLITHWFVTQQIKILKLEILSGKNIEQSELFNF